MKIKKKEHEYDNQGYPIYLWNWELKAEFGAIIVMQDWPKGIFFQSLADFSNTDSHLLNGLNSSISYWYLPYTPNKQSFPIHKSKLYLSRKPWLAFTFFIFPSSWINVRSPKTCCLTIIKKHVINLIVEYKTNSLHNSSRQRNFAYAWHIVKKKGGRKTGKGNKKRWLN